MLRIKPTWYIARRDYSPHFLRDEIVKVDAVKRKGTSVSGMMLRVVGVWKRPQWFDSGWFKEVK